MNKINRMKEMLGIDMGQFDVKILNELISFEKEDDVFLSINSRFSDNFLYAKGIIQIEEIICIYERKLKRRYGNV